MNDYKETKRSPPRRKHSQDQPCHPGVHLALSQCFRRTDRILRTAYVVNSELFKVREITIKGNEHMDNDEVLALSISRRRQYPGWTWMRRARDC